MVRTIGRLERYCVKTSRVTVTDWRSILELVVDCRAVEPFPFKKDSLFQFIGEVDENGGVGGGGGGGEGGGVVLRVYSYRCVDGLDMDPYIKALTACNRQWQLCH